MLLVLGLVDVVMTANLLMGHDPDGRPEPAKTTA